MEDNKKNNSSAKKEFFKILRKIKKENKHQNNKPTESKEKTIFEYGYSKEVIDRLSNEEREKLASLIKEEYDRKKEISDVLNQEYFLSQKRKELSWRMREEVIDEINKLVGNVQETKKQEKLVKPASSKSNVIVKEEPKKEIKKTEKKPVKKPGKAKPVVIETAHVENSTITPVEVKKQTPKKATKPSTKKEEVKKVEKKPTKTKKVSTKKPVVKKEPKIDEVQIMIDSFKNEEVDKMPQIAVDNAVVAVEQFLKDLSKKPKKSSTKKTAKPVAKKEVKKTENKPASKPTASKKVEKKANSKKVDKKSTPVKKDDGVLNKINSFQNEEVDKMPVDSVKKANDASKEFTNSKKAEKKPTPSKKADPKKQTPVAKQESNAKVKQTAKKTDKLSPLEDLIDQSNHGLSKNINKFYDADDEE